MTDAYSFKADKALIAVAWAQFLILLSVVPREHLQSFKPIVEEINRNVMPQDWRTEKFISLALALNLVSLVFLSIPVFVGLTPKHTRGIERVLNLLGGLGLVFWFFSFLTFLGYFNQYLGLIALLSLAVAAIIISISIKDKEGGSTKKGAGESGWSNKFPKESSVVEATLNLDQTSLLQNKRELFDGMRAYHASEIAHVNNAIKVLLAIASGAVAVMLAILFPGSVLRHEVSVVWALFLLVLLASVFIAIVYQFKICADHKRYAELGREYVKTSELLGFYSNVAINGESGMLKATWNIGGGSGYRWTLFVIWALAVFIVLLTFIFALISSLNAA